MKTTTGSVTPVTAAAQATAVGLGDLAKFVFLLFTTFAFYAAVLLAAARLTGFAWSDLGLFVLPPAMAGSGAVLTFFALNHMALQSEATAADSPRGHLEPRTWATSARAF